MEVGAVKQAFNNEVILLKKKLNQAKIHIIHKLTRKAKTLTEKKAPENLKEKNKRKAKSAVKEVLIIKKVKARDIAKFIITHTGKVNDYLNKPNVDNDKACARLVLHKSLQEKYKFFRNRFGNIPIKDLFMSRQERRKLKKEAKEDQKNKKKGKKGEITNSAGDWNVEDMDVDGQDSSGSKVALNERSNNKEGSDEEASEHSDEERIIQSDDDNEASEHSDKERIIQSDDDNESEQDDEDDDDNKSDLEQKQESSDDGELPVRNANHEKLDAESSDDDEKLDEESDQDAGSDNSKNGDQHTEKLITSKIIKPKEKSNTSKLKPQSNTDRFETNFDYLISQNKTKVKDRVDKKVKENKNKNLKEKMQNRKFKKDEDDEHTEGKKVVDPFFITSTGENYLSLAEPRQPDEVKEIHKQGNRQERRAAMFGRKFKPKNDFRGNNSRFSKFDDSNAPGGRFRNDKFSKGFNDKNVRFNDRNERFNDRNGSFNDRNSKYNDRNSKLNNSNNRFDNKFENNRNDEKKEEKLHPSWEAKRKMKSMSLLPSQGKKIVFNDN